MDWTRKTRDYLVDSRAQKKGRNRAAEVERYEKTRQILKGDMTGLPEFLAHSMEFPMERMTQKWRWKFFSQIIS